MKSTIIVMEAFLTQLVTLTQLGESEQSNKVNRIIEFLSQNAVVGWVIAGFTVVAIATTAIAKLTGNLDKILEFIYKYRTKKKNELSEKQTLNFRNQLIRVEEGNVAQRIEDSLHNLVRIDLDREEQRQRVGRPSITLVEEDPKPSRPIRSLINRSLKVFKGLAESGMDSTSPATAIAPVSISNQTYDIYHRNDIQGRLLILGEPGAGKTTELLLLAEKLIGDATESPQKPIPIIFELSAWRTGTSLTTWLCIQLYEKYRISKDVTAEWIRSNQLLPLLDGLDELGLQNQVLCIAAINECLLEYPALQTIVCCRREEYEKGNSHIDELKGAIYLQPARHSQVRNYLKDLNRVRLWEHIQAEPELLSLAQYPLFLTMMVVAHQACDIRDKQTLLNAYIEAQLTNPDNQGAYKPNQEPSKEKTLHYLAWLALHLEDIRETEFLIEELQPSWLRFERQRIVYDLLLVLNLSLSVGLLIGLPLGLLMGFTAGIAFESTPSLAVKLSSGLWAGTYMGLWFGVGFTAWGLAIFGLGIELGLGVFFGLVFWMLAGPITGLVFGLGIGIIGATLSKKKQALIFMLPVIGPRDELSQDSIEPTEQFHWSSSTALERGVAGVLKNGVPAGLIFCLMLGAKAGLLTGVGVGLVGGLLDGLIAGLSTNRVQEKTAPNQGIRKSVKISFVGILSLGLGSVLVGGLVSTSIFLLTVVRNGSQDLPLGLGELALGLVTGTLLAVLTALPLGLLREPTKGIKAAIQHLTLRILLTKYGYAPWNYEQFLEHAVRHRLIQRTGGRYRFIHDLLRKHFAQMPSS